MKISEQEERALTADEAKDWLLSETNACKHHHVVLKEQHSGGTTERFGVVRLAWCPACADPKNNVMLGLNGADRADQYVGLDRVVDVYLEAMMPVERIEVSFKVNQDGAVLEDQIKSAADAALSSNVLRSLLELRRPR